MSRAALLSALVYTGASALAGGIFFAATFLTGDDGWVARAGGSVWVFVLTMIILMPTVTPWMKARVGA